jgi:hypothetical protein
MGNTESGPRRYPCPARDCGCEHHETLGLNKSNPRYNRRRRLCRNCGRVFVTREPKDIGGKTR